MWGGYSQIAVEMLLLETAVKNGEYRYYHLISGEDFPLKPQKHIHSFFDKQRSEFVMLDSNQSGFEQRVRYYYFFQERIGRNTNSFVARCAYKLQKASIMLQKFLGVYRNKGIRSFKGSNWFSITDGLARYIVSQKKWVTRHFKYSYCADEVFLPTIVCNSPFVDRLTNATPAHMRKIDWKRGTPYVFRTEDYEELISSDQLFARKFSCEVDDEIINRLREYVTES